MVRKIQNWLISSRNRVYQLYKSVPFTEKRPRRPETSIKDGFEEMEHEFPFGYSTRKDRTNFSDVPLLQEIFRWNDPKSRVPYTFQPDFPYKFGKW